METSKSLDFDSVQKSDIKKISDKEEDIVKVIVFDVGGVLYKDSYDKLYRELSHKFNFTLEDFYKSRRKFIAKATKGKLKMYSYEYKIAKNLGLNKRDQKLFVNLWISKRYNSMKRNNKIYNLLKKLKKKYILATLTNAVAAIDLLRRKKNFYKFFDCNVISYKVKMKKPNLNIYNLLIKKLKKKPAEIIYIDDNKKNLIPAKKLGMRIIFFKNTNQLIRNLREIGVVI